jgi:hypothetical protein
MGVFAHGLLERPHLVSHVAAAAVLGASAARYRSHNRARWTLSRDWRSLAGAGPPNVSLVALGLRWHPRARALPGICGPSSARWSGCWKCSRRVAPRKPTGRVGRSSSCPRPCGRSSGIQESSRPTMPPRCDPLTRNRALHSGDGSPDEQEGTRDSLRTRVGSRCNSARPW